MVWTIERRPTHRSNRYVLEPLLKLVLPERSFGSLASRVARQRALQVRQSPVPALIWQNYRSFRARVGANRPATWAAHLVGKEQTLTGPTGAELIAVGVLAPDVLVWVMAATQPPRSPSYMPGREGLSEPSPPS
jgi:hypothetical protein